MRQDEFENPGPAYRIHPFWFWNGEMEDEVIREQIREMAEQGVGGFFLCARQGLKIAYLSREWFDKVRVAVEAAEACGLHVWLYDEYPYPSGMAGGEVVLRHPEAKLHTLECERAAARGGESVSLALPWARVLYAKAVPVTEGKKAWDRAVDLTDRIGSVQTERVFQKAGLTAYNRKRYFTYRTALRLDWTAPEGEWEIFVVQEKEIDDFKYYGTFVDPCNAEAMRTFIRLTHDRYDAHLRSYFGTTVKGIFTDEVGLLGRMPWSTRLPGHFKAAYGYDLPDKLHALFDDEAPEAARVRSHYYEAVHTLLRDAYHRQVADWCRSRGLQYVAEAPSVRHATMVYSDIPGGDAGHEKLGRPLRWVLERNASHFRYNPKMVSSLARQLDRPRNLIECFHSVGWSMTLQDARWMIDWLASMGTNMFNFHAFFYTLDGLRKHDAPPSQFVQNPYWKHFRQLADYVGRISYVMSSGSAMISTALLEPTESLWPLLGNPFHGFSYGGRDPREKERLDSLRGWWVGIMTALTLQGRDYDHLDPSLLAEAEVEGGEIRIGRARYDCLVLPPMTELQPAARKRIETFLRQGGKVVALGMLPGPRGTDEGERPRRSFGLGEPAEEAHEPFWAGTPRERTGGDWRKGEHEAYFLPFGTGDDSEPVMEALRRKLDAVQPLPIRLAPGGEKGALLHCRRLDDGAVVVFVANQEEERLSLELKLDAAALFPGGEDRRHGQPPLAWERLDLETGAVTPQGRLEADGGTESGGVLRVPLELAPYASVMYRFRPAGSPALAANPEPEPWSWRLDASAAWEVRACRANALRLGRFRFGIATEDARIVSRSALDVEAKTLVDQCADLAEREGLPVRMRQLFGTPMRTELAYPLYASYSAAFRLEDAGLSGVRLVMDEEAVQGKAEIAVNGRLLSADGWERTFLYDHRNLAYDITPLLVTGRNEVSVHIRAERDSDGLTDPLYVTGDFRVTFAEDGTASVGRAEPASLPLRSGPYEGYPHYAGELSFRRTVRLEETPGADSPVFELIFDGWDEHFHEIAEVKVNGRSVGTRAWSPYRWTGDSSLLRTGDNEVEVIVTNTLAGLLEGKYFDYSRHELLETDIPGE